MMTAQSGHQPIETWFLAAGHLGGAGVALVVPVLFLMGNMSQGAMGGGISAAVARALGGGRQEADQLVLHAVVLNAILACSSVLMLASGRSVVPHAGRTRFSALDAARPIPT